MGALVRGVDGRSGHHHYIVTEDLYPLMRDWAKPWGFVVPNQRWFAHNHSLLRQHLEESLTSRDRVVIIDSLPYFYVLEELQQLVYRLHAHLDIEVGCVISLDRVYGLEMNCPHFLLEVNRLTDLNTKEVSHRSRPNIESIEKQIGQIIKEMVSYHVIVVDDGIWTGDSMRWILQRLQEHSLKVEAVVVGVHIKQPGHAVDFGIKTGRVQAVQTYTDTRPVLDWVCERDFFIGVPLGGRTITGYESLPGIQNWQSVGACYSSQADWLRDWASINGDSESFMRFCLERSAALFTEIENLSHTPVILRHLARLPLQVINGNVSLETPVCEYLRNSLT